MSDSSTYETQTALTRTDETQIVSAYLRGFRSDPQPPSATGRSHPNSTDFAHGHSPSHHHNVAPQLYRFPLGYGPLTVSAFVLSK